MASDQAESDSSYVGAVIVGFVLVSMGIILIATISIPGIFIGVFFLSLGGTYLSVAGRGIVERILHKETGPVNDEEEQVTYVPAVLMIFIPGICFILYGLFFFVSEAIPKFRSEPFPYYLSIVSSIGSITFLLFGTAFLSAFFGALRVINGWRRPGTSQILALIGSAVAFSGIILFLAFIPGCFITDADSMRIVPILFCIMGLVITTFGFGFALEGWYHEDAERKKHIKTNTNRCYRAIVIFTANLILVFPVAFLFSLSGFVIDLLVINGIIVTVLIVRALPATIRSTIMEEQYVPQIRSCAVCNGSVRYIWQYRRYWCDDCSEYVKTSLSNFGLILEKEVTYEMPYFLWIFFGPKITHRYIEDHGKWKRV